jgi:NADPH:quinone reductase-like Zn-dependent oxidoreductase
MKAIRFHGHGGPEVLKYEDAAEPALRGSEVLVRVKACALNHLDLWVRRGLPNVPIPLPHIPGSDVAGEDWSGRDDRESGAESGADAGSDVREMRGVPGGER